MTANSLIIDAVMPTFDVGIAEHIIVHADPAADLPRRAASSTS